MLRRFKIKGHSMEPSFKEGDRVLTKTFFKIKDGDAVVFNEKNRTYLKRVKAIRENQVLLRGDNEKHTREHLIDKSKIKGKVVMKY